MASLVLSALVALATLGDTHNVTATTYYRTFSHSHPVLERVKPGDLIVTKTLDSAGVDENNKKQSEPFNPLTGPFFVEGAEPGDALVVRIKTLRMNRDWGWSAFRLGLFSITPEDVEKVYSNQYKADLVFPGRSTLVPWDIDRARQTVKLREPKTAKIAMEFPAKPMLGCIGVAPAGDFAPTSGPSGHYGGNIDYNKIGQGVTVTLPVYHPGGLLFVGDGHALQGDGESTGTGIETSMDLEFTVELKKGAAPSGPRVETVDEIISVGSQPEFASALDNGLKMANSDMIRWLIKDYGLEPWAAHLLIGYQAKYDVVTVAGSMAVRIPKAPLPPPVVEAPKAAEVKPQEPKSEPGPIASKTAKLAKVDGFLPLYWEESTGKVLMEIPRFDRELLYQVSLTTGVGSNPIGLDRGQLGSTHVVAFRRVGPKVLLEEPNYRFRALSDNLDERRSVDQSFAKSVLAGFKIEAEEAGRVLVDATSFFSRDAHGVAERLASTKQGKYKVDENRSGLDRSGLKAFPKNTEVEATLTFSTDDDPGRLISQTAPAPRSITVVERHSLVELPDLNSGYKPRKLDPRVGVFGIEFADFATPTGTPIETRWISRHRLLKKDPNAAVSDPVTPLVYYVDRGAPEPIRSALVEGARWWSKAFEAAGFSNAFRVEVLPEGADPMDVRYNVIHWVHRSTRGWSYGSSVTDPRTGEILKGVVSLDSQRARQDALIGSGLVPSTSGCAMAMPTLDYLDPANDAQEMVLARIRQLSAHEVGHTLGFAHNFAASTYNRGSVMDYPAPLVKIVEGKLDLSDAYAKGIGTYDEFATKFAYSQFPPGVDEAKELAKIVEAGVAAGMLFLSDDDARPAGAAHPLANLWDNGDDPVAMLRHELEVRRIGLSHFGLANLPEGAPLSDLEAKLLPLYLHHRYQLTAALKTVGGVNYTNSVKTAGGPNPPKVAEVVPAERQREALKAVLETLDVKELMIPTRILDLIPPTAFGHDGGTAELFTKRTQPTFDPIGAATVAADLVISGLLQPQRAARLIEFHAKDPANPGFDDVVGALLDQVWEPRSTDPRAAAVQAAIRHLFCIRLMELAANESASPQVRASAETFLRPMVLLIESKKFPEDVVDYAVREEIIRFLARPDATHRRTEPLPAPPGDPIGSPSH